MVSTTTATSTAAEIADFDGVSKCSSALSALSAAHSAFVPVRKCAPAPVMPSVPEEGPAPSVTRSTSDPVEITERNYGPIEGPDFEFSHTGNVPLNSFDKTKYCFEVTRPNGHPVIEYIYEYEDQKFNPLDLLISGHLASAPTKDSWGNVHIKVMVSSGDYDLFRQIVMDLSHVEIENPEDPEDAFYPNPASVGVNFNGMKFVPIHLKCRDTDYLSLEKDAIVRFCIRPKGWLNKDNEIVLKWSPLMCAVDGKKEPVKRKFKRSPFHPSECDYDEIVKRQKTE